MSGIAGLWRLDGRPVVTADVERMLDRLAHRGPDGAGVWTDGPVGLGHRLLHTTPESLGERQPVVTADGRLVLTGDVRLDDRDALEAALGAGPPGDGSDAALVLRAYQAWGAGCVERLLGDFAFAVWDRQARTLFCARDPLGVRPFYYHHGPRLVAFASEIKALFTQPEVPRRLDETRVADFLVPWEADRGTTFFADVRSLAPGHAVTIGRGPASPRAYWVPDADRGVPPASDAEHAEALREALGRAVRARLHSARPLGATLSGGLDSSSVVGTARQLRGPSAPALPVISAVFPDLPATDERRYIDAVVARGGVVPSTVRGDHLDPLAEFDGPPWDADDTFHGAGLFLHWEVYRAAAAGGLRVLLVGTGGDLVVSHGGARVHELMRSRRWLTGAREAIGLARSHGLPLWRVGLSVASPVVPRPVWQAGRWARRRGRPPGSPPISPDLARRVGLADRLRELERRRKASTRDARSDHARRLAAPALATILQSLDAGAAARSLEIRDPFLDRRVVELCLALPADQKLRDGRSRGVLRRAMAAVLPAEVQDRPGKADFRPLLGRALETFGRERLDAVLGDDTVLEPFVDLPALRRIYRRYLATGTHPDAHSVWKAATLARWLTRTKLTNGPRA